jgi:hypothetical protein
MHAQLLYWMPPMLLSSLRLLQDVSLHALLCLSCWPAHVRDCNLYITLALLAQGELQSLMAIADVDGDGLIDYNEFVAATMHLSKLNKEELLQKVSGDARHPDCIEDVLLV